MKKIILFTFLLILVINFNLFAQTADQYSFSASSGSYSGVSGGTALNSIEADEVLSTAINIGFTFNYCGTNYTQVKVSSNGWLTFDVTETSSQLTNDLEGTTYTPKDLLAPLWDDLDGTSAAAKYKTTGTAGNQVFTMQFNNWLWNYSASGAVINFQIKLYESDNHIEFVYKRRATAVNSGSASIGIQDAAGNFQSLNNTSASPTPSSVTETTSLSSKPATGQIYAWTPPVMTPMAYSSCTTTQTNTSNVGINTTNNEVIGVEVVTTGYTNPLDATSFTLKTTGTTAPATDITNAKLWSTGTSGTFATTTQVGSVVANPNGTFTINGTTTLSSGTNYFWLTYDVPSGATLGNVIDAQCTSVTVDGSAHTPTTTAPAGNRPIDIVYCSNTNPTNTSYYIDDFSTTNGTTNITNNNSGFSTNGYGDFTGMTVTQQQGLSVDFSVDESGGTMYFGVWIDWNQDGDFVDAGEEIYNDGYYSSATGTITVPITATLGSTRMRVVGDELDGSVSACGTYDYSECEDYTFVVSAGTPMTYASCTTTQTNTSTVGINTTNNEVIGVEVVTTGAASPIDATSFTFNTTGTTAPATDITNAKLWSTGTSGTFATGTQVGTTVSAPNGSFTINVTTTLSSGTNYFWLTYDVPTGATVGNVIDAQCTSVTVDGSAHTPTITAPAGNRPIDLIYCSPTYSNTTDEWITNVTFNTINNNSGQEGANSYGDYTGISTTVEQGSTYSLSVSFNSIYTQDIYAFFDWNHDGDFNDANEQVTVADDVTTTPQSVNVTVPGTATLGNTRMRIITTEDDTPDPCPNSTYGETEDYTVNIITSVTPMSFVSCTTTQPNTTDVGQGSNNKEIVCVEVVTSGMISPISVTGFRFRTTGTTDALNDIQNAKIWYTGNSSTFAPTNQFGTTVAVPPTSPTNMDIGGSQTLVGGTNYFWLSYDIQSSATVGNVVDAVCDTVQVSGDQTPTVTDPAGSRTITPPPPVSDDPCGATVLAVNSGSCSYQTGNLITTTTASAGIPAPGCGSLGPDIWYKFTVPASGRVIVDLDDAGGPTDMCMAWYSSSTNDCNNIDNLIDCDDDDSQNGYMPMLCYAGQICTVPGDCQQENVLTPGMTVYVRIWESGGGTFGPFDICAYEPDPPGAPSSCASATNIASLPYSQSNTTCCRQNTYSSSVGCGSLYQDGEDYIYKYTPSVDQDIDITLTGTSAYTGVFVTDGCPDVGACVASQTESGGNPMLCGVSLTAGTTYYIMISTDPSPDCTPFSINVMESTTPTCNLNYTISSTSYSWDNFFGTNIVLPVDDRFCDAYIPIPFKFCYDGYQATHLLVSSNGYIIFDPISCSTNLPSTNAAPGDYSGWSIDAAIPNTTNAPRNAILCPWHDINPAVGGVITYGILGTAPNRRFIVSWVDAPLFDASSKLCTQQIKLYETTYDIEVHMKDKKLYTSWNGGAAILGLHNYNGTLAQVPAGYNYPATWSAHNEAWKFTCNCTGCISPLPIELINFEGNCYQNNIELTWTTASEENNQNFTIEKSVDGINFASIGTVEGAGNSSESHDYSFMDKNNGYDNVYYRLKQTDFDGTSETTRPIVVKCNSMTNNVLVSPNPAKVNEPITIFGNFQTLKVNNVLGSDIKAKIEGNKILGLPKGVYFIVIDGYYTTKIVVQ